ncbi:MAG: ATP-binding protein [Candidatus Riflebacteria bacterium]
MAPSTALFLALLGLAIMSTGLQRDYYKPALFSCFSVFIICIFLTLTSGNGVFFDFEHPWLTINQTIKGFPLGHISPLTSGCLALSSFSLMAILTRRQTGKPEIYFAAAPTVLLLFLGFLLTIAYVFGGVLLYDTSFIPPAATTSIALTVLGLAILSLTLAEFDFSKSPSSSTVILITILFFLSAGIIGIGYFYFQSFQISLNNQIYENFHGVSEQKARQLQTWREERIGNCRFFFENPNFVRLVENIYSSLENRDYVNRLNQWLSTLKNDRNFAHVFLMTTVDSKIYGDEDSISFSSEPELRKYLAQNQISDHPRLSNSFFSLSNDRNFIILTVPIRKPATTEKPIAMVCAAINPESVLIPTIHHLASFEKNSDSFICCQHANELDLLCNSKIHNHSGIKEKLIADKDFINFLKLENKTFFSDRLSPQDGEIDWIFVRKIPDSTWLLITRASSKELLATARERLGITVIVIGLLLLSCIFGIVILWQLQHRAFYIKQNEAAEALIQSENKLRQIFENIRDGILIAGIKDRKFVAANSSMCRMLGFSKDELLGKTIADIHPADSLQRTSDEFDRAVSGELEVAKRIPTRRKDGSIFLADINASFFNLDNQKCIIGVFRDMTSYDEAERKILHLNSALTAIRHVNQLITRETDPERLLISATEKLFDSRGFASVAMVAVDEKGMLIHTAFCGKEFAHIREYKTVDDLPDNLAQIVKTGKDEVVVTENSCSFYLPFCQNGSCYGFMAVMVKDVAIEVGEEKSLLEEVAGDLAFAFHTLNLKAGYQASVKALATTEEQLRQSQKLDAIGQLAGGIAHDFNNLLMVQLGYCEVLKETLKQPEQLDQIDHIDECAKKAAGLTRQLLAFSRKQNLQPERTNLNQLVESMMKLLKRLISETIEIFSDLDPDLWEITVDPGQIEQVLVNLAVNARDAMKNGGRIIIKTKNFEKICAEKNGLPSDDYVLLSFEDNGSGIPSEIKDKIFEPFFTTKPKDKGTGLGLSTVYGIVKQSGGFIDFETQPGKGTCFNIFFPKCQISGETAGNFSTEVLKHGLGQKILIVEDEKTLNNLLKRMVSGANYEVFSTAGGLQALEFLENNSEFKPDLVITDMVMPGMGGIELIDSIRKMMPGIRFLCMSGYTEDFQLLNGNAEGVAFLQKPFSKTALLEKIEELLKSDF